MRYIEVFYNRWRPHTNNDALPPAHSNDQLQDQEPATTRGRLTNKKLTGRITSLTRLSASSPAFGNPIQGALDRFRRVRSARLMLGGHQPGW